MDPRTELLATIGSWGEATRPIAEKGRGADGEGVGDTWTDGRNHHTSGSSILDAELLAVFLVPQDAIPAFSLSRDDEVPDSSLASILNGAFAPKSERGRLKDGQLDEAVSQTILDLLEDYVVRNSEPQEDGTRKNLFTAGSYALTKKDEEPQPFPVVDSYSLSISVCLQGIKLLTAWLDQLSGRGSQAEEKAKGIERVRDLLSERLTSAMVGLCRSFAIYRYDGSEVKEDGRAVEWGDNNRRLWPNAETEPGVYAELAGIQRRFKELTDTVEFEIGFTWGPTIEGEWEEEYENLEPREPGGPVALSAPYFYFTVLAVEACRDIARIQATGAHILSPEQTFLASRLAFLSEMTSRYWAALALEPDESGEWPISDLPWMAGGDSSDYWTLYLLGMVLGSGGINTFPTEESQIKLLSLVEELAQRGRLIRRLHPPYSDEPGAPRDIAVQMHTPPGKRFPLTLEGNEGSIAEWSTYDFGPRTMKLAAQIFGGTSWPSVRERASDLVTAIWRSHLELRKVRSSDSHRAAWDDIRRAFVTDIPSKADERAEASGLLVSSWYITERVVEALTQTYLAATEMRASSDARTLAVGAIEELRARLRQPDVQEQDDLATWLKRLDKAESLLDSSPSLALGLTTQVATDLANL